MARPKSQDPKKHRLEIRLTDDELDAVEYIAMELKLSKSEAVLDAVMNRSEEIYRERQRIRKQDPQGVSRSSGRAGLKGLG